MTVRAHGQLRRSQVITTWGPGSLLDLPAHSVIVGGLDSWPKTSNLDEVIEPRLVRKLQSLTGTVQPRLYAPPAHSDDPSAPARGIGVWRFPEWFLVQEDSGTADRPRSRRLVHRKGLDEKGRFDGRAVVPTRFVRACPKGHIDDLDWRDFVHGPDDDCLGQLWLDERGTGGDLGDLVARCACSKQRGLYEATVLDTNPLGGCRGRRPWLGTPPLEACGHPNRLLIRTASNAYFAQVLSALSIPEAADPLGDVVTGLWDDLGIVDDASGLGFIKKKPKIAEALAPYEDNEVLAAIEQHKSGPVLDRPVKQAELDAILAAPQGYGEDIPIDPDFHARRLPDKAWRRSPRSDGIECVTQLHRLREVLALVGFTRFEAVTPDIQGEYETDVERAVLALDPQWYPAVENRGEGVFLRLRKTAIDAWLSRPVVRQRIEQLVIGHEAWQARLALKVKRPFPGGPYVLLHTLSHLLLQSLAMRCGYPASSIRERIYVDPDAGRYGVLLYTGTSDAEGTLGGLVQQARHVEAHLGYVIEVAELCSNDPICALHEPGGGLEERWLHGAACHGCSFVAETSCEMRNDYLDRALVVPVLGLSGAAFFA